MSYQVLARKWRPQQFGQLVGQQHVKSALGNALNNNRLHHAYLFTGTRGVGKTTIARIFAKSLNCEQGISATPCGQCSACIEIDAGNFVDLLEIDAASRTKVEDTRDILDNVQYAPSRGRYKVYLIDEVHMLSKHSFNALLKTLEEPPPHVKFMLATTDPQKLPVTVLSRCLQFNLLALSPEQIKQHLTFVLTEESIAFEPDALALIARAAKGSLRDSLSLTDQAIAQSNANLTLPMIRNMLGFIEQNWSQQLLMAILQRDAQSMQQQLTALVQQHSNFAQVLDDMLSLLHLTALTQLYGTAARLGEQQSFVSSLAKDVSPETVQLYYQLLISGKKELPYAPDLLTGLEMALMRAMAFVPAEPADIAGPLSQQPEQSQVQTAVQSGNVSTSSAPPDNTPQMTSAAQLTLQPGSVAVPSRDAVTSFDVSENTRPVTDKPATKPEVQTAQEPEATSSAANNASTSDTPVIDNVTARIMQRRGLSVNTPNQNPNTPPSNESVNAKKFERQAAQQAATPSPLLQRSTETPASSMSDDSPSPQDEDCLPPWVTEEAMTTETAAAEAMTMAQDDSEPPAWLHADYSDPSAQASRPQQAADKSELEVFDGNINEQNFSVRFAAQVDNWAKRVEQLETGGLDRLFLLNSSMQLQDEQLQLTVNQSQQHLDSPGFRTKLQQILEQSFGKALTIDIHYQADVPQCPLAIQQRIEQERKSYVCQLFKSDENILALQQLFNAELLLETVQVN